MFFVAHLNQKRKELARLYGQEMLTTPCFLFLDGHKSRINSMAIEFLYQNYVRVIILPAHSSHITQPFDVAIAAPFKMELRRQKDYIPKWLEQKIQNYSNTAKKRYLLIINIIDAWKQASTSKNIKSGWEKAGIYPLNEERVLNNVFVRKTTDEDLQGVQKPS